MRSFVLQSRVLSEGVCMRVSIRFNFSQTVWRTNVKLATIGHYVRASVQRSHGVITKLMWFDLHFLTDENGFLLKQRPVPNLSPFKNFIPLWVQDKAIKS